MNKKRPTLIMAFIGILITATPAYADLVWPALFLINRMVTWWAITVGLLVEYLFVRRWTKFSVGKSVIVDVSMNATSTLLGLLLIPIAGIGWEFFPGIILYKVFHIGTFNPGTWVANFLLGVFINAELETLVITKAFKCKMGWRGFGWLSLANAVSVGIAFYSVLTNPPHL